MSTLEKRVVTEIIPGNPGVEADPGHPGSPARCYTETVTVRRRTCSSVQLFDDVTAERLLAESGSLEDPSIYSQDVFSYTGGGYTGFTSTPYTSGGFQRVCVDEITTEERVICVAEIEPRPAVTGVPPTAAQIKHSMNQGWNTWARSVNPIPPEGFIQYQVAAGVWGACVGLGPAGQEGAGINGLAHAIIADSSGIKILEAGQVVKSLRNIYLPLTRMRLTRQRDGSVVYLAITDKQTLLHVSAAGPTSRLVPSYAYGKLYSGGDSLNSPAITAGQVQFARVAP